MEYPPISAERRLSISYHEAGHAIVSMALGLGGQEFIQIAPPDRPEMLGIHRRMSRPARTDRGWAAIDNLSVFVYSAAGWLSECRLSQGVIDWDGFYSDADEYEDSDAAVVNEALSRIAADLGRMGPTDGMQEEAQVFAEAAVNNERIWGQISRLGERLNEHGIVDDFESYGKFIPHIDHDVLSLARRWARRFRKRYSQAEEVDRVCTTIIEQTSSGDRAVIIDL